MARPPKTWFALVAALYVVQPLLILATGSQLRPAWPALMLGTLLLWGIARGSLAAWALTLAVALLFSVIGAAGLAASLNGAIFAAYDAGVLSLLLSPSLRRLVGGPRRGTLLPRAHRT